MALPKVRKCGGVIGSGSHAVVYCETRNGSKVAVKRLRKELVEDLDQRMRFEREINLLSRLSHPNIVSLHDRIGRYAFSMDYVDRDLGEALSYVTFRNRTRLEMMSQLASALDYMHSGIEDCVVIHRDIKPENVGLVLLDKERVVVKLVDFGLAVTMPKGTKTDESFRLTGAAGSVRYMAPECASYESYGTPADVFSFSLVCWEVLSLNGKPFGDLDVRTHIKRVVKGTERPSIPKDWAPRIRHLIASAWTHDPLLRPTAGDVRSSFLQILEDDDDPLTSYFSRGRFMTTRRLIPFRSLFTKKRPQPPPPFSSTRRSSPLVRFIRRRRSTND